MVTFNLESTSGGVRITMISIDKRSQVSVDCTRSEVERLVTNLCFAAGLSVPWKG